MIPGIRGPLEKEMAIHSSILAWEVPWTEEPGRLQSMGSQNNWLPLSNYTTVTKPCLGKRSRGHVFLIVGVTETLTAHVQKGSVGSKREGMPNHNKFY